MHNRCTKCCSTAHASLHSQLLRTLPDAKREILILFMQCKKGGMPSPAAYLATRARRALSASTFLYRRELIHSLRKRIAYNLLGFQLLIDLALAGRKRPRNPSTACDNIPGKLCIVGPSSLLPPAARAKSAQSASQVQHPRWGQLAGAICCPVGSTNWTHHQLQIQ